MRIAGRVALLFAATLAASVLWPLGASGQETLTAVPVRAKHLDVHSFGPDAEFINGSILRNAITALTNIESKASARIGDRDLMEMGASGRSFTVVDARTHAAKVEIDIDDNGVSAPGSREVTVAATMRIGELRAVRAAYDYFSKQSSIPAKADRRIASYDVLVFPKTAARYFVGFLHHRPAGSIETIAGCFDGSGYNGEYYVDAATLAVS
jgi:hypothetical protein